MKRRIKGRTYDTETATKIGTYQISCGVSDPRYWTATLYRIPQTERFFLYGQGGSDSPFANTKGDITGYGFKLQPLIRAAAFLWARLHLPQGILYEHFPDLCDNYNFGKNGKPLPVHTSYH